MAQATLDPRLDQAQTAQSLARGGLRWRSLRVAFRCIAWFVCLALVIAAPFLGYAGILWATGNIDTVEPGKVYRSATLSATTLTRLIEDKHIRTVINLRGENPAQTWYQDEVRVTDAEHVKRVDLAMSAIHEPTPEVLERLIETLRTAEAPILIHCSSGSDRTGLAAAIYQFLVMKVPADTARRQLSFYWGHFPWLGSPTRAMDRTFDKVVASH